MPSLACSLLYISYLYFLLSIIYLLRLRYQLTPEHSRLFLRFPGSPLKSRRLIGAYVRHIALDRSRGAGMGSVAITDVTPSDAVVTKRESSVDRYSSFSASTQEEEDGGPAGEEHASLEPAPPPKRKGGRKPVCRRGYH